MLTHPSSTEFPLVSVLMPIRNEAEYIAISLSAVLSQDYPPERMQILLIDGRSTDETCEIIRALVDSHPRHNITIINNPKETVPFGLNMALGKSIGEVIVRVDGHCQIAPDYIRRCVQHLREDDVDGVGGPIETIGKSFTARVISTAMSSFFGVGGAAFRTIKDRAMLVDTVAFPAYTRKAMDRTGPFDVELVRNQDDEYNYRMRKNGGKLLLSPDIRSRYFSRPTLRSLWGQYFHYGFYKVLILQKHPRQMCFRQFVPPVFVAALMLSYFLIVPNYLFSSLTPLTLVPLALVLGSYTLANLSSSIYTAYQGDWRHIALLPAVYAILHLSYGLGFLLGLVRFGPRWWQEAASAPELDLDLQQ